MVKRITINLDSLLELVRLATRRASAFMALGIHAANDDTVNSLSLDSNFQIQLLSLNPSKDSIRNVQDTFRTWIIGNGLRELDQFASLFADSVYEICRLAQHDRTAVSATTIARIEWFKGQTNVAQKFRIISEEFGIASKHVECLNGLSKARNALSHNLGKVGERHTTDDLELRMSWLGMEMKIGDRVVTGAFEPIYVETDTAIQIGFSARTKSFQLHSLISLTPHELHEICLTYLFLAEDTVRQLKDYLRDLGIFVPDISDNGSSDLSSQKTS